LSFQSNDCLIASNSLEQCSVTDAGLAKLGILTSLTHFSIGWCGSKITNEAIGWLDRAIGLTSLNISYTNIDNAALWRHLPLRHLSIIGTKLTDSDMKDENQYRFSEQLIMSRTPRFVDVPLGFLGYSLRVYYALSSSSSHEAHSHVLGVDVTDIGYLFLSYGLGSISSSA
jgi:hypothetical protein